MGKLSVFGLALGLVSLSAAALAPREASACGGCFQPTMQARPTQVTGHRMILSVSQAQTTLYDQIEYAGAPDEFAWVLPIKGKVEVGTSSDALFNQLETLTQVNIYSPPLGCPPPPICNSGIASASYATATGANGPTGGGVTVIAEETVGPYETVQLSSADPAALQDWLSMHGYELPADVAPIVSTYVSEGFDFLAIKLVPGSGISSMQPVRVTSPGAGLSLPLRMVAAGTGATTPLALWVIGEGRYEPSSFPSFAIDGKDLVWSWDEQKSNYAALVQAGFEMSGGKGWLIDAAEPMDPTLISYPLTDLAAVSPEASGYGGMDPAAQCADDLKVLFGSVEPGSMWVTRMRAELPKSALATDLTLGASADQSEILRSFYVEKAVGTAPQCPVYPPCQETSGSSSGQGGSSDGPVLKCGGRHDGGCMVGGDETHLGAAMVALAAALASLRKRRR